ncbi:MAG: hypothetical protein KKC37_12895 [Proteobacteria bacterium]|nr:hypothetical protein [Pseudomonadota bacterium]
MARFLPRPKNVLLVLGSIVLALVAAEVAIRVFAPWPFYSRGMTVRFHPEVGWTFAPNRDTLSTNQPREYVRPFRTNSLGFRDAEHRPIPTGGAFVALGDSYTVAREVFRPQRWPEVLARLISNYQGRPTKSLNFACDAYSPTQYWLAYKWFGRKFPHKLVIVLFYTGNDFADVIGNRNTPFLAPGPGGFRLVRPQDPTLIVKRWGGQRKWYKWFHLYNRQRDFFAGLRLKRKWRQQRARWDGTVKNFWKVYRGPFQVVNPIYRKPPAGFYWRRLPLVRESFRRLQRLVKAGGATLVVFIMPQRRAYGDRQGVSDGLAPGLEVVLKTLDLDQPQQKIKAVLQDLGIEAYDLTPALRRLGSTARDFNFPWDTHLTAKGQAFIAKVMFDFLRKKGLLKKAGLGPAGRPQP